MKQNTEKTSSAVTRRQFLMALATSGAALLTAGATKATAAISAPKQEMATDPMSLASLSHMAGSTFEVTSGNAAFQASLERVTEQKSCPQLQQYTAVFRIQGGTRGDLTQKVYELHHPELGKLSLLMSPCEAENVQKMSASFCQLIA